MEILTTMDVFLQSGFVFSLIAMGYYISYTILDFPDLTVEGTFLTGAVVYGIMVENGINAWLGLLAAFLSGCFFGAITGILHVKCRIRPLLCGILVSTALISINLVLVGAGLMGSWMGDSMSSINFGREALTLGKVFPFNLIPAKIEGIGVRNLVIFLVIVVFFQLMIDIFLKTKRGMLLFASGDNDRFVTTLSLDAGNNKILGLAIGNGYAAVAGVLYTLISGNVNQGMGIGTIVIGLASLIIGLSVFNRVTFLKPTSKVILGAVIYQMCLTIAQKLGVPSVYNKLIMAIIFTIALIVGQRMKRQKHGGKGKSGL